MKKYLMYALTGVLLTACGKEELPESGPNRPAGGGNEIRFEIGIAPSQSEAGPQTRVATDGNFKCTWEAGDTIALFAFKEGATIPSEDYYIKNAKLAYDGTSWTSETPLYWPADGKKLRFYACCPHTAMDGVKDFDFDVLANQNMETEGKSNLALSDLMLSAGDWTAKSTPIDLVFSHYACMVQVKLDDPHHKIGSNETITVKLRNVKRKVPIKLRSEDWSVQSGTSPGDVTMQRVERSGDANYRTSYTFRAIIPKQMIEDGICLYRISIGNSVIDGSPLEKYFSPKINNAYLFTAVIPSY